MGCKGLLVSYNEQRLMSDVIFYFIQVRLRQVPCVFDYDMFSFFLFFLFPLFCSLQLKSVEDHPFLP